MEDDPKDIVVPILKQLQTDMSMVKESIRRIDSRLGSIESHVAGIFATSRCHSDDIDMLRGRVEALEPDEPN